MKLYQEDKALKKYYTFVYLTIFTSILFLGGCASASKTGVGAYGDDPNATGDKDTGITGPIVGTDVGGPGGPGGLPDNSRTNPGNFDFSTLKDDIVYFGYDSFSISAGERGKIEAIAKYMKDNSSSKILIAGNTDSRGTTQYNLALGERRALAVRDYLIGLGIGGNRISTVSYGKEKPAEQGENEAAWAKNRRAETGVSR